MEITWQKAQFFTGLNRRSGEDDSRNLSGTECPDGHGHGQIGLSGTCRADPEADHIFVNRINILFLPDSLRLYRSSGHRMDDDLPVDLNQALFLLLRQKRQGIIDILLGDRIAARRKSKKHGKQLLPLFHVLVIPDQFYGIIPLDNGDSE